MADTSARGERLDAFLSRAAGEGVSRGAIQQWIKAGLALVDGGAWRKPGRRLDGGEHIVLRGLRPAACLTPERGDLDIVWRDTRLLVLDKPAGLTTHPAPSCPEGTLVHRLLHRFPELAALDRWRPGIVHRLDKDTSGLMLVALDEAARLKLQSAFAAREVRKAYLALVHGAPDPGADRIDAPVGRDPKSKTRMAIVAKGGREAQSAYENLWTAPNGALALVKVRIFTGRTHQIRVHLAHIGHPIVGDAVYGPGRFARWAEQRPALTKLAVRQMLHAYDLAFEHPADDRPMHFRRHPPKDFRRLPLIAGRSVQRVGLTGLPGSGKSLLCRMLAEHGVAVFSADGTVAELYSPGADGAELIRRRWGERFLTEEGAVDKRVLFAAMRAEPHLRHEVEALIHPLVAHRMGVFFAAHAHERLAVAEVPLLIEAKWASRNMVDVVVGLRLDAYTRHTWLARRGLDPDALRDLEGWHLNEDEKLVRCDLVVANPGDEPGLRQEARALLTALRARRVKQTLKQKHHLDGLWTSNMAATGSRAFDTDA